MSLFKRAIDFYLQASIHVALAGFALVLMTFHMFDLPQDYAMAGFAFFGIIVGYNFVKYDALARTHKLQMGNRIKAIATVSFVVFCFAGYCFLKLQLITQIVSVAFLALTLLYTLPFFPNRRNARNWAGVKIYIVALCWVGVTLVLPVLNADVLIDADFYVKCLQRFLFVFVLVLLFEIIDLAQDDPHLKTVPQQIGVRKTKLLAVVLLVVFYFLEFLKSEVDAQQLIVNLIMVLMLMAFTAYANITRSKYYTAFWVELMPVFWYLLLLAARRIELSQ
ncbi:MAG TPA: hypothetical protein VFQ50_10920 [Flavobacterium sp.]|jgi:hypothetical protein|nr:hypothetical protein [Flavobacterium sp.]